MPTQTWPKSEALDPMSLIAPGCLRFNLFSLSSTGSTLSWMGPRQAESHELLDLALKMRLFEDLP